MDSRHIATVFNEASKAALIPIPFTSNVAREGIPIISGAIIEQLYEIVVSYSAQF